MPIGLDTIDVASERNSKVYLSTKQRTRTSADGAYVERRGFLGNEFLGAGFQRQTAILVHNKSTSHLPSGRKEKNRCWAENFSCSNMSAAVLVFKTAVFAAIRYDLNLIKARQSLKGCCCAYETEMQITGD